MNAPTAPSQPVGPHPPITHPATTSKHPRAGLLLWVLLPVALAGLVALGLVLAGDTHGLRLTAPLTTIVATTGVFFGLAIWVLLTWKRSVRSAAAKASAEAFDAGRRLERDAHNQFLARLDHELKNPLTAIQAAAASVSADNQSGPLSPAHIIDAQAGRMARLVRDLRKIAALETQPIEEEPVNLELLAEDVASAAREHLAVVSGARTISVSFPQVPWPVAPVRGDVDLLFVALFNLVSNAVKFSGDGARIEVRGIDEMDAVVVEVADTGMGIPAHEVSLVWEELARGGNARGIAGSGLGLAMVQAIVRRHHGQVSVSSREGHGTSVRLRLPTANDSTGTPSLPLSPQ